MSRHAARSAPARRLVSVSLVLVLAGCGGGDATVSTPVAPPAPSPAPSAPAAPAAPAAARGVDLSLVDHSVRPGDDFFRYANGSWLKSAVIPADRPGAGAWLDISVQTEDWTVALLEDAAAGRLAPAERNEASAKAGAFFASMMDRATIDALGARPLAPLLARIDAIKDKRALASVLGAQIRADVDALNATRMSTGNLFGVWIDQDLNDPSRTVPFLLQGGLGMPDRSYYVDPAAPMAKFREDYRRHLVKLLELAGVPDAEAKAKRVVALETRIAQVHATRSESGDVKLANHPWKRDDFAHKAPGLDWRAFFAAASLGEQQDFIVWQPTAFTGISALVASVPLATWKEYLVARAIDNNAALLARPFEDEDFAFYSTEIEGTPKMLPRPKLAAYRTGSDYAFGNAVGRLYVGRHFPEADKRAISRMVGGIVDAFAARIDQLAWMTPETKAKAKEKLRALYVGVGYPESWQEYGGLEIKRDDLFGNAMRVRDWRYHQQLAKLGKRADQKEWCMSAQEVNAVNLPVRNALNFPAAILQAPFYREGAPAAVNYGGIGAVIGHEISHSFDNQGSAFDASGKFVNWWTPADLAHFEASSAALVAQYAAYKPFPDLAIDGQQTLGENIADLAGLAAAHDAWIASLGGQLAPVIDGLSGEQQFFLAFAQTWRDKLRDEAMRDEIHTDGHAIPAYRALTVRNLDAWYPAFDVKPTDALYLSPEARVRVW